MKIECTKEWCERMAELEQTVSESALKTVVMYTVLDLLQADPHQWSTRPCSTCKKITSLSKRNFGCDLYRERKY